MCPASHFFFVQKQKKNSVEKKFVRKCREEKHVSQIFSSKTVFRQSDIHVFLRFLSHVCMHATNAISHLTHATNAIIAISHATNAISHTTNATNAIFDITTCDISHRIKCAVPQERARRPRRERKEGALREDGTCSLATPPPLLLLLLFLLLFLLLLLLRREDHL